MLLAVVVCIVMPTRPGHSWQGIPDPAKPFDRVCRQGRGWLSPDKACHFVVSASGTVAMYAVGTVLGLAPLPALGGAAISIGALGVLREIIRFDDPNDLLTREQFSRRDMVWNVVGILFGLGLVVAWRRGNSPPRRAR